MLGPLVMHLRDGGYLFCGWPPRSLSWKRTPLPHCPLAALAPYQPWNKKTTEYSLVEHVVVASYGVSWLKVTCASGRFLYSTSPAMLGWVSLSARGAQRGRCTIHFGFTRRRNTLWWWYGCEQRRPCWRCVVPLSLPSIVRQRIHLTSQFFLVHSPSACRRAPSSIVVAWSRCPPPSPLLREQLPSSGRPPGGCLPSGRRSLLQRGGFGPYGRGGGASA